MSIWHDDKVFPEDKRYWIAFINVRSNGNKFWTVSHHLSDFIEDVSGAGFKVCNTKIEKWCYLDDLFAQQAEINRLRQQEYMITDLFNQIDAEYSAGINTSENTEFYVLHKNVFNKLDVLFTKWEKMKKETLNGESEGK